MSDLAAAHLAALRVLESGAPSAAYNLGSERGTSIREVLAPASREIDVVRTAWQWKQDRS